MSVENCQNCRKLSENCPKTRKCVKLNAKTFPENMYGFVKILIIIIFSLENMEFPTECSLLIVRDRTFAEFQTPVSAILVHNMGC